MDGKRASTTSNTPPHSGQQEVPVDTTQFGHQNMLMIQHITGLIQNAMTQNRMDIEQMVDTKLVSKQRPTEDADKHIGIEQLMPPPKRARTDRSSFSPSFTPSRPTRIFSQAISNAHSHPKQGSQVAAMRSVSTVTQPCKGVMPQALDRAFQMTAEEAQDTSYVVNGSMEQPYMLMEKTSSPEQIHNINGPIAILWDMENCSVPSDVRPDDVAGNIRMALRDHPIINGPINMFSAYGDFNGFPRRVREGCYKTGVKLIDVPNGKKDAADKAILVDMFLFALDNPPPSSIMLISGDVDFSPALHVLGQRGYTVILMVPSGFHVNSALRSAGSYVWDWPSLVRGEGFVPPSRSCATGSPSVSGLVTGAQAHISDDPKAKNEEEPIAHRGTSVVPHPSSDVNGSSVLKSKPNRLSSEFNDLKVRVVKLLESFDGCLPMRRIIPEHQNFFGKPFYASDYGTHRLVNLLRKMSDVISVEVKGENKFVYLKNSLTEGIRRHDRKGKGIRAENTGVISSDDLSGDERMVMEEQDNMSNEIHNELNVSGLGMVTQKSDNPKAKNNEESIAYKGTSVVPQPASDVNGSSVLKSKSCSPSGLNDLMPTDLNGLKVQLVKLLELFGGSLPLGRIHMEYQKCFGRPIWVSDYGTSRVIHLLNKMSDVISVEGKGENKLACLKNSLTEATKSHDWKGKEIRADNTGVVSSDELSRDQRMVVEEQDNKSDKTEAKIEEKSIVYREISIVPPPSSDIKGSKVLISKSNSPSSGLNDLNGLKFRLVKLLEMYNGCLPIARLNSEYKKVFGKPFHLSDYGASRAVQLLKKMTDVISVEGKGDNKLVYLKNSLMEAAKSHDMKGKGVQHENTGVVSSNEKVVIEENDKRSDHEILNDFKYELQEILKSHSCWIYLGCFEEIYQQRYKRPLDYKKFGVNKLEELFEKVKDVVALPEEPSSKKKFLVAVGL